MSLYELHQNGYLVIRNALNTDQLKVAKQTIDPDGMVDYTVLKEKFIDNIYLSEVNKRLGWECIYNKFRFSSSKYSNLKDASRFHCDIYNFTKLSLVPVYTALCHLDAATLEVIPRTHQGIIKPDAYKSKIQIKIEPGDIVIFHSNLHHRGLPENNERRIIQIFEIFTNNSEHEKYNNQLLTVVMSNCWIVKTIRDKTSIQSSTNFSLIDKIHYWALVNNIQYSLIALDIPLKTKLGKFIGYEPGPRDIIKVNTFQPLNINIIVRSHPIIKITGIKLYLLIGMIFITFGFITWGMFNSF
jgi:hypothetical protein